MSNRSQQLVMRLCLLQFRDMCQAW